MINIVCAFTVEYAQIDWHDFVIVETINFRENEAGPFVCLSVRLLVHLSGYLLVHLSSSVSPSHPSVCLSVRPSVCLASYFLFVGYLPPPIRPSQLAQRLLQQSKFDRMAEDGGEVQEIEMEVEEQDTGDQVTPTTGANEGKKDKAKQVKGRHNLPLLLCDE